MRLPLVLIATAMLGLHPAGAAGTADVTGNWKDPDNGAILAFADCDGDLCGKIAAPASPDKKDAFNPDPAKQGAPLAGLTILDHAKAQGNGSWKGNLYNADDGKTYSGYVTFAAPDKLQLKGCALLVFCKTLVLTKAP
jgi:uncharacterized protein (DUF2147 family)